ncbi:hypothetical protein L1987_46780 [Smallanthus sonchifolius]|uniref:Uncharacterized protein n=1 Tax=Smallanthus sonchifolius TaxID=185202 RepID=A0ACB9G0I9_9ASTR|nr:hypothetical protein L1987_46780 [Smallanthus sonchifolius]
MVTGWQLMSASCSAFPLEGNSLFEVFAYFKITVKHHFNILNLKDKSNQSCPFHRLSFYPLVNLYGLSFLSNFDCLFALRSYPFNFDFAFKVEVMGVRILILTIAENRHDNRAGSIIALTENRMTIAALLEKEQQELSVKLSSWIDLHRR